MMNLIASGLLSLLEKELVNLEPELQTAALAELQKVGDTVTAYVNSKLGVTNG